jgi:hypothetical protein
MADDTASTAADLNTCTANIENLENIEDIEDIKIAGPTARPRGHPRMGGGEEDTMSDSLAIVTGELMAALDTAMARGVSPDTIMAIRQFARYCRRQGIARRQAIDLLQRMLDQAVITADAGPVSIDAIVAEAFAICVEQYNAMWPVNGA